MDAFVSITFPYDPSYWKTHFTTTGALKKTLLEDFRAPLPHYLSEDDKQAFIQTFKNGGFTAPSCWYKIMTNKMSARDDQGTFDNI